MMMRMLPNELRIYVRLNLHTIYSVTKPKDRISDGGFDKEKHRVTHKLPDDGFLPLQYR